MFKFIILVYIICWAFIFLLVSKKRWRLYFKLFGKRLLFYLIMFVLLFLLFEVILSIGGYFYFYIYSNLDRSKIENDAFRILFLDKSTTTGAGVKEENAFRILFLGESTTRGGSVGKQSAYPAQVEKILQQKYPNKKIRAYNKGILAIQTILILRDLNENMIKYKPDLIILMAGFNDVFHPSKYENLSPPYKLSDFTSQSLSNFNSIIQKVHSYDSEIWFAGYLQPDAREKVNPILRSIVEENNITYVGDYPKVDFVVNHSLFAEDGWHPSEEGHRIIAEKIVERIISESIINRWQPD